MGAGNSTRMMEEGAANPLTTDAKRVRIGLADRLAPHPPGSWGASDPRASADRLGGVGDACRRLRERVRINATGRAAGCQQRSGGSGGIHELLVSRDRGSSRKNEGGSRS